MATRKPFSSFRSLVGEGSVPSFFGMVAWPGSVDGDGDLDLGRPLAAPPVALGAIEVADGALDLVLPLGGAGGHRHREGHWGPRLVEARRLHVGRAAAARA